ncbi:MAG: hypothetical protein ICV73_03900 [Acetobacteraceae bacterium]|nr:hypothetical protein [Acetobacteraceae bacterium]
MSRDFLHDRERALEDAFFAQQDQALLRRLREADAVKSKKAALSAASGIGDDAVLERLVALGIDGATVAALSLVPLVLVAWADGSMHDKEREAALSAAAEVGVEKGSASHQLLERWLSTKPPPQLLAAWTDYVRAITPTLGEQRKQQLKADLLGRARKVAEAGGGLLGFGFKTSPGEDEVLAWVGKAFA